MPTGRLVIYLLDESGNRRVAPVLIKAENIRASSNKKSVGRLVDATSRLGAPPLHRIAVEGTHSEAALFLVKNRASLDIGMYLDEDKDNVFAAGIVYRAQVMCSMQLHCTLRWTG